LDLSKLTTGDRVIGISAIVYLIAMFLPWYGISDSGINPSNSGWSYFLGGIIPFILIALVVARVAIVRFSPSTNLPDLPIPWSQATLIAAVVAAVIVVLRLLIKSSVKVLGFSFDLDRKYGLFIATLAAIGVAVGAFLKYQAKEDDAAGAGPGTTPPTPF
jgi:hypothetical protein